MPETCLEPRRQHTYDLFFSIFFQNLFPLLGMAEPAVKRRRVDEVVDAATACGIGVGTELEVQWDLEGGVSMWWACAVTATNGLFAFDNFTDNDEGDQQPAAGGGAEEGAPTELPATHTQCYTLQYVCKRIPCLYAYYFNLDVIVRMECCCMLYLTLIWLLTTTGTRCRYVADSTLGWGDEDPEDLKNRSYFLDDHMLFDIDFGRWM